MGALDRLFNPRAIDAILMHCFDRSDARKAPAVDLYRKNPNRWVMEKVISKQFMDFPSFGRDYLGRAFLSGFLRVRSKRNHEYGPFAIRMIYPAHFPHDGSAPNVYLMSHRDRWTNRLDSHIEHDWRLCLFIPAEAEIDFRKDDSLKYLLAVVATFLRKEVMYQEDCLKEFAGGPKAIWPGRDRAHGVNGIVEVARERGPMVADRACLCGSGNKFVSCCRPRVLREINDGEKELFPIGHVVKRRPLGPIRRGWGRR